MNNNRFGQYIRRVQKPYRLIRQTVLFVLLTLCYQVNAQSIQNKSFDAKAIIIDTPSGNEIIDRELILSALQRAKQGDTIQFSPGIYLISRKIQIDIDAIILRGVPNETIIRGCNPEKFTEPIYGILNCGGFELVSQGIIVENFIFEFAWHGLMVGCCLPENVEALETGSNIKQQQFGGHIIQRNIFRYNSTGIRVIGINPRKVIIQDNVLQDNFHGLTINGSNVLVKNNRFYMSTPEKIPIDGKIDNAMGILPFSTMFPAEDQPAFDKDCKNIEIIGNTIEDIENYIRVSDFYSCKTIIKDNIIINE